MNYVIEDNVPIPSCRNQGKGGRPRGPIKPWQTTLDALEPGQSTFTGQYLDVRAAEQFKVYRPERHYVVRKIAGQGWRVWRVL